MFQFITDWKQRREGGKQYQSILDRILTEGSLTEVRKSELEEIMKKFGLQKKDVIEQEVIVVSKYFTKICEDRRVTEEETKMINAFANYFEVQPESFGFDQSKFNTYTWLSMTEKGKLPVLKNTIDLPLENGETLHCVSVAILRKYRKVTRRINYGGLTASIRIMKGLSYRTGSLNIGRETENVLTPEDVGAFFITNERVGFHGKQRRFSIPFTKINSFEVSPEGLYIFKNGKETPYILTMDDYELPAVIVSQKVNEIQ